MTIAAVFAGYDIALRAWSSLRLRQLSIELLVIVAAIGALFINNHWESAAVTFLFMLGAWLESRTMSRTRGALKALIDAAPVTATVLRNGETIEVAAHEVSLGETVLVKAGERLPVDGEVIVLELSSYQTDLARALTPDVAIFTNLSPDHLDRHGGMGGYFAAKRRLFAEGGPDRAVIGVDEMEGQYLANQLAEGPNDARLIRVSVARKLSGPGWDVGVRKGWLSETRKGRQVSSIDLRGVVGLPGVHNHQNAACAYGALRALSLPPKVIEAGFHSFQGLPHRSQRVGEKDGVIFVNDSKATNADAAAKALAAFPRIRWICGGLEKEGGLAALQAAVGNVIKAYVIGREAQGFALQLGDLAHEVCGTMDVAVARAIADAEPGETVLLAPAAASFDQYDNFEQRGQDFIDQVARLIA